jgi:hypothetical protein
MSYQALILAAGASKSQNFKFEKCKFQVRQSQTLLEVSLNSFSGALRKIVALNPSDFRYFEKNTFGDSTILHSISRPTQGALATTGMCLDFLTDDVPTVIAAVDGICNGITEEFLKKMIADDADGGVVIFPSVNPVYSYVRVSHGFPIEFAEKIRISDTATAGVFYFKNKRLLLESIEWAIMNQIKYEESYYLSSAMNKFIFEGKKVVLFETNEDNYYRFSTEDEAKISRDRMEINFG